MATERANDLRAFKGFIDEQLAGEGADLTVEEALARWEYENTPEAEKEATLQAIREGLADMYAGRTVDAFESAERLRQRIESIAKR